MLITARTNFLSSRFAGSALLCLVFAGFFTQACSKDAASPQEPSGEAAGGATGRGGGRGGRGGAGGPVPVVTAHVVSKAVPVTIPAVGTAEPLATVQVRAQVTGQLSAIHFTEGQEVRKGEALFTLDARPFEAALQQAEAVLARDSAQAKNAQAQRARYEDLFKRGLIPRDQYETQMANATALESTLAADQAQIENAKLNLQYTHIVAPIAGRTGSLNVHQGDLVRANDTNPLVIINQVAPIYVTFSVPGRYLPDIRRYQAQHPLQIQARIQAGGTPGAPQVAPPAPGTAPAEPPTDGASGGTAGSDATTTIEDGTVSFIDNTVDPTTGTIRMKGTFGNADHALWPGLFVQVTLVLRTDANAIVVPSVAVQTSQAGQFVFVVKPDRTAEIRDVTVQREQGDEVVISHGLSAGEEVVTDGQLRLNAGSRVVTGTRGEGAGAPRGGNSGDTGGRRGNGGRRGANRGNQS